MQITTPSTSQTGIIFAALFMAWVIFITTRGELVAYYNVFFGSKRAQ